MEVSTPVMEFEKQGALCVYSEVLSPLKKLLSRVYYFVIRDHYFFFFPSKKHCERLPLRRKQGCIQFRSQSHRDMIVHDSPLTQHYEDSTGLWALAPSYLVNGKQVVRLPA
ncbi:hypothetical protein MRX96_021248 [Rhipicephalus microplus]